jgi:hypothetical protein
MRALALAAKAAKAMEFFMVSIESEKAEESVEK